MRLASILSALKELGVTERDTHLRVLRQALESQPHSFGVWAMWERDALDGRDSSFANAELHDATGRFMPLWQRGEDRVIAEFLLDGGSSPLHASHQQMLLSCKPRVIAPHERMFDSVPVLLATVTAPIFSGQRCVGSTGMDFELSSLAERIASGRGTDTAEFITFLEAELGIGLVFLDQHQRVAACSDAAAASLRGFIEQPLERDRPLPGALQPGAAISQDGLAVTTLQGRGASLKVTQAFPVRDGPNVIVLTKSATDAESPPLSVREEEVMRWLSEGKSNEEIGIILSISPHTVKNHLDRIYRKIGVDNRHAAMLSWTRSKALPGMLPCA